MVVHFLFVVDGHILSLNDLVVRTISYLTECENRLDRRDATQMLSSLRSTSTSVEGVDKQMSSATEDTTKSYCSMKATFFGWVM